MAGIRQPAMEFSLTRDTAIALQDILTQQSIAVTKKGIEVLERQFDTITPFYNALTEFVERNT